MCVHVGVEAADVLQGLLTESVLQNAIYLLSSSLGGSAPCLISIFEALELVKVERWPHRRQRDRDFLAMKLLLNRLVAPDPGTRWLRFLEAALR